MFLIGIEIIIFFNGLTHTVTLYMCVFFGENLVKLGGLQRKSQLSCYSPALAQLIVCAGDNMSLVHLRTAFSMIGKFGICGAFAIVFLYTPELFPTTIRFTDFHHSSSVRRPSGMVGNRRFDLLSISV